MTAAALAALPLGRASDTVAAAGARVSVLSLLVLLAALVHGLAPLVPAALLGLGGLYAAQLAVDDAPLDLAAPLFAGGLLVTAELAFWALDERERVAAPRGEGARRLAYVAALGVGAVALASALLVLVDAVRARGLALDLAGAASAAAVLLLVLVLARRRDPPGRVRGQAS